jgi:RNA polymerase sigma-70 factor (ECF subfamily)
VYVSIKDLRSEGAFVTWLFSIARNVALRHWERQKKHRLRLVKSQHTGGDDEDTTLDDAPAPHPDPLSQVLHFEKVEAVSDALGELPSREQACLRASILESLTYKEIGERLGISENTVAVHVHRGMKALKKRLRGIF